MTYINVLSHNNVEKLVQEWYLKNGYQSLRRGWPDFVFWKKNGRGRLECIFVEVKRPNQNTIKSCQRNIKNIFRRLGLDYRVAFGVNEDGSPNFRKVAGIN